MPERALSASGYLYLGEQTLREAKLKIGEHRKSLEQQAIWRIYECKTLGDVEQCTNDRLWECLFVAQKNVG